MFWAGLQPSPAHTVRPAVKTFGGGQETAPQRPESHNKGLKRVIQRWCSDFLGGRTPPKAESRDHKGRYSQPTLINSQPTLINLDRALAAQSSRVFD
jgi:hypothetical protein